MIADYRIDPPEPDPGPACPKCGGECDPADFANDAWFCESCGRRYLYYPPDQDEDGWHPGGMTDVTEADLEVFNT